MEFDTLTKFITPNQCDIMRQLVHPKKKKEIEREALSSATSLTTQKTKKTKQKTIKTYFVPFV